MPIDFQLDEIRNLLVITARGEISVFDRAELVERVIESTELPDAVPVMIDVTQITKPPSTADVPFMAMLATSLGRRFKKRIGYVVVKSTFVVPYLFAAFQAQSECQIRAFMSHQEALEWLIE